MTYNVFGGTLNLAQSVSRQNLKAIFAFSLQHSTQETFVVHSLQLE